MHLRTLRYRMLRPAPVLAFASAALLALPGAFAAEAAERADRHPSRDSRHRGEHHQGARHHDGHHRGDHHRGRARDRDRRHHASSRDHHRRSSRRNDHHRSRGHDRHYDRQRSRSHHRSYDYRSSHGRSYGYSGHGHRSFSIPRYIGRELLHHFRSYFYASLYYEPHGHAHSVYRFPAYGDHGVSYRPYAYCEGDYYSAGSFRNGGADFGSGYRY